MLELDRGLGPDGRRWIYAQMLERREAMLGINNQGVPRCTCAGSASRRPT